jgi:hypothetical protein
MSTLIEWRRLLHDQYAHGWDGDRELGRLVARCGYGCRPDDVTKHGAEKLCPACVADLESRGLGLDGRPPSASRRIGHGGALFALLVLAWLATLVVALVILLSP